MQNRQDGHHFGLLLKCMVNPGKSIQAGIPRKKEVGDEQKQKPKKINPLSKKNNQKIK